MLPAQHQQQSMTQRGRGVADISVMAALWCNVVVGPPLCDDDRPREVSMIAAVGGDKSAAVGRALWRWDLVDPTWLTSKPRSGSFSSAAEDDWCAGVADAEVDMVDGWMSTTKPRRPAGLLLALHAARRVRTDDVPSMSATTSENGWCSELSGIVSSDADQQQAVTGRPDYWVLTSVFRQDSALSSLAATAPYDALKPNDERSLLAPACV